MEPIQVAALIAAHVAVIGLAVVALRGRRRPKRDDGPPRR
jgi:hypothetical protein